MDEKHISSESAAALRQRAEARLLERSPQTFSALSPEKAQHLLHELQVHQIELEIQNDELHAEMDALRARYFDLYDLAPVGYLSVGETGQVVEGNFAAARLLGVSRDALVGQPFTHFILPADQDLYDRSRRRWFEAGIPQVLELRLLGRDATPFHAHLEATVIRAKDGSSACRIVLSDITARKPVAVPTGGTVLLAEDNPQLRKMIVEILQRLGFSVLAAADGVEALEFFHQHRNEIGCLLSDVRMPRMDGWELLTAVRQVAPGFPVILSSGYGEPEVIAGEHLQQPQAFLSKPYSIEALGKALRQLMPAVTSPKGAAP